MHSPLTENARCLCGDAYVPAPTCGGDHQEHLFVERLTFARAEADRSHAGPRD
ncbi:hypothetical protein ACFU8I_07215 [Streptomyces sp. NPDC057540]|uniref:hypothetical protein n=1 Tax=Streptomyces sp. NPDC057540 TaxID=3346160 RepID=UPI00368B3AF0